VRRSVAILVPGRRPRGPVAPVAPHWDDQICR